jgi:hypothetical protein
MQITRLEADAAAATLTLTWLTGLTSTKRMGPLLKLPRWHALRDPDAFAQARLIDGGRAIGWGAACPEELGADQLWLEVSESVVPPQAAEMTAGDFDRWMQRCGYSLTTGATALGLTRRTLTRYRTGKARIPRVVKYACILIEAWLSGRGPAAD